MKISYTWSKEFLDFNEDYKEIPEIPESLNRHIKVMYEIIGDPNIEIYLENPAGIGEHPEVLAAIDSELHKLAEARDKLLEVNEL